MACTLGRRFSRGSLFCVARMDGRLSQYESVRERASA